MLITQHEGLRLKIQENMSESNYDCCFSELVSLKKTPKPFA